MCWLVGSRGKKYFEQKSLYSLFWNVSPEIIFDILHETGVVYKIWSMLIVMGMVMSGIFKELFKLFL